jgi:hypothetical protein
LYESSQEARERIIEVVVSNLPRDGVFISMEPAPTLARRGCRVDAYLVGRAVPYHVADVSDGHFIGQMSPGRDFPEFAEAHLVTGGNP